MEKRTADDQCQMGEIIFRERLEKGKIAKRIRTSPYDERDSGKAMSDFETNTRVLEGENTVLSETTAILAIETPPS